MLTVEEKYHLYENSVQCHDADIDFINEQFKTFSGRKPLILRRILVGQGCLLATGQSNPPII